MKPWSGLTAETVTLAVVDVSFTYSVAGGVESWLKLCDELHSLVDSAVATFGGIALRDHSGRYEFVYGFNRATSAVAAMVHLQRDAIAETMADGFSPALRCALLTGELPQTANVQGESSIDLAKGLKDLAYVNQILVSVSTRELCRQHVEEEIDFRDLGLHRLQRLGSPQRVFQVLATGLPSEFPALRSLESVYTNLPSIESSFVGRDREMFEVAVRLRVDSLLTIVGAAGVGKSRLALQVARVLLHDYPDGAFTIDFGELTEASFILETIAAELPFLEIAGSDLANNLRRALSNKQILLVLDNCDNIPVEIASQVDALFVGLKGPEAIFTCRRPLGFSQEAVYRLPPLDNSSQADEFPESRPLLLQRIRDTNPRFILHSEDEEAILGICNTLRGVPLAIELAASRFRDSTPDEVLGELKTIADDSLSNRPPDLQKLVDQVFRWIHDSLPALEQKVFRRLSSFSNGWSALAAGKVCSDSEVSADQVNRCERLLVQKGLVRRARLAPNQYRDCLCQALWQYAHKLLADSGEIKATEERHLEWIKELSVDAAERILGPSQSLVLAELNREKYNFRVAIERCLNGNGDFESAYLLILGFEKYWYRRGFYAEGKIWLERLLESTAFERSEPRARALNILGVFLMACGDEAKAITFLDHALDISSGMKHNELTACIMSNLGICHRGANNLERASQCFKESAGVFRIQGNQVRLATALNNLGSCLIELKRFVDARAVIGEAISVGTEIGDEWVVIMSNYNSGFLDLQENLLNRAESLFSYAVTQWHRQRDLRSVAMCIESMAVVGTRLGQDERATVLLGAAAAIRNQIHQKLPEIELQSHEELIDRLSKQLGPASFFRRWSEGSNFTPEAAVAFAVGGRTYAEAM